MPILLALPSIYTRCKLADFKISLNCGIENFTITDFKVSLKCGIETIINFALLARFSDDLSLSSFIASGRLLLMLSQQDSRMSYLVGLCSFVSGTLKFLLVDRML